MLDLNKEVNVFEKYGIDKYMTAFGLSVNPSYRGAALGGHLLNARYNSLTILFNDFQYFSVYFLAHCFLIQSTSKFFYILFIKFKFLFRVNIGREYNIPVTITAFTSPISQKLAERCGFETLIEKNYDEYVDEKGNLQFPGITAKSMKLMGKRLL